MESKINTKMHSNDRVLNLRQIPNENPVSSLGLIDRRLFTGENKLHAIMDPENCLWSLKYENGILPNPLKQRWTSFTKMLRFAEDYFKKRNIEIVEVIDG